MVPSHRLGVVVRARTPLASGRPRVHDGEQIRAEATSMAIKLYDLAGAEAARRFSPYCWRTRMALAHKGLAVETIPWRFSDKQVIAPYDRVPVIVDGEQKIGDSWVIADHLEEAYPDRPSLFEGSGGRALSLLVNAWADNVMLPGMIRFALLDIYRHIDERDKPYFRTSREARLGTTLEAFSADRERHLPAFRQSLEFVRRTLKVQNFLGGDHPLYADYIVFGGFQWARAISPFQLLEPSDPLAQWRERMLDCFGGLARRAPGYPV
jgi:glutathione S-transferase